jgi:hypothetical protein
VRDSGVFEIYQKIFPLLCSTVKKYEQQRNAHTKIITFSPV